MKNNKDILVLAVVSLTVSIIGFILDLDERVPDIMTNLFEILMMAVVAFGIISVVYFPIRYIFSKFRSQTA